MKVLYALVPATGLMVLVACGCTLLGSPKGHEGTEAAGSARVGAAAPLSPLQYTPASEGLPQANIWKSHIAFGDVNGDGIPDLGAVSRLADGPWIWVADGKGGWKPFADGLPREPFCGGGMAFADLNNDGKMDVVFGDHCKGVFAFVGDGEGHWKSASSGLPTIGAEDVAVGDFNHDGCVDIVSVAQGEEGVRAFRGNCKGVWAETSEGLALTNWGNSVVLADINADGNLDIAAAYAAGPRVWLGDGKGKWKEASAGLPAPEVMGLYWGISVGDLNGDGKLDLVSGSQMPPQPLDCGGPGAPVCEGGGVEVFLQQPDGGWRSSNEGLKPMNALGVAIGDLNNDGNLDIVVNGKAALKEIGGVYGIFPYLGDGTGKWRLQEGTGLPLTGRMRTWGVGLADVNRDGVLDVGVAFGDVVAPAWHSGEASRGAQRGKFGSVEVWFGSVK
jgi:hypothetical protein